jgi:site-specific DNA-methyltransferase (adenine-specific)
MDDNAYDLAIIDCPYGIGESGSTNHTRGKMAKSKNYKSFAGGDVQAPSIDYFNELIRVSKNQIIWGANHFISRIPFDSSCWIVWDKVNGETDFADCELAWTSFKTAVRKFEFRWQGMLQQDMKNKETRIHPTQKPVKLYEWLLTNYAKEGDKILDTHGGSCSIALACHNLKFDLDLWELDEDYHAAGVKRFEQHKKQLQLF